MYHIAAVATLVWVIAWGGEVQGPRSKVQGRSSASPPRLATFDLRPSTSDLRPSGQLRTLSRAPYVHRLTLYDHDGEVISPEDNPPQPYSPYTTCGKCHPIESILCGWHFNAGKPGVDPGRPGEPWILTDPLTGTQLPLSARGWPGTYAPSEAGLSNWEFVLEFGRHLPGGIVAQSVRGDISGPLEIDCMFCHSGGAEHDPAEAARQIARENLKWSATAALGLAVIRGEARNVPDDWDPFMPPDPDYPERSPPLVVYDRARFDADDRVVFDITRRPDPGRCYFCHTALEVGPGSPPPWQAARDVHLSAGMVCTDCHRNDIKHMISRGYDGEADGGADLVNQLADPDGGSPVAQRSSLPVAGFSCKGCHLGVNGDSGEALALGGRYGAPHPLHRGMPTVHFEKLTCTACHSGPLPREVPRRVQTSMAHGLGLASKDRGDNDPPRIVEPIFARNSDGQIAPHRMLWPAFWGRMKDGAITPLPLEVVRRAGRNEPQALAGANSARAEALGSLTSQQIARILSELTEPDTPTAEPVYVRNGRVYRLESRPDGVHLETESADPHGKGLIVVSDPPVAGPYLWPIGHDVRPAAQSLGVRGCTDCHARDAPFVFGRIWPADEAPHDPHPQGAAPIEFMYELQGTSETLAVSWAASFRFRGTARWVGISCVAVIGAVLLLYALRGLDRLLKRSPWSHWTYAATMPAFVALAATGFVGWLVFDHLAGWLLLAHMLAAPLFVLGLTLLAVTLGTWRSHIQQAVFLAALLLGFVVIASILAAMLPVFGYAVQETLYDVHRASSVGLLVVAIVHVILLVKRKVALRGRR